MMRQVIYELVEFTIFIGVYICLRRVYKPLIQHWIDKRKQSCSSEKEITHVETLGLLVLIASNFVTCAILVSIMTILEAL